jgi:hypothetical protein|tara:strand:- start:354 stop:668 length:315 start_codon:yes stop_codon:yes gene_type:complete
MVIKVIFKNSDDEERTIFVHDEAINMVVEVWNDDMSSIDTDFNHSATEELISSTDSRQFWFNLEFVSGVALRLISAETMPVGKYKTPTHFQGSPIAPAILVVVL